MIVIKEGRKTIYKPDKKQKEKLVKKDEPKIKDDDKKQEENKWA